MYSHTQQRSRRLRRIVARDAPGCPRLDDRSHRLANDRWRIGRVGAHLVGRAGGACRSRRAAPLHCVHDVNELGRKGKCDAQKLKAATAELLDKSLIAEGSAANVYQLTEAGCQIYNRLVAARREHLAGLWPEWSPRKREEVAEILRRLARELIPEAEAA